MGYHFWSSEGIRDNTFCTMILLDTGRSVQNRGPCYSFYLEMSDAVTSLNVCNANSWCLFSWMVECLCFLNKPSHDAQEYTYHCQNIRDPTYAYLTLLTLCNFLVNIAYNSVLQLPRQHSPQPAPPPPPPQHQNNNNYQFYIRKHN